MLDINNLYWLRVFMLSLIRDHDAYRSESCSNRGKKEKAKSSKAVIDQRLVDRKLG